jgi:hypothetical protein
VSLGAGDHHREFVPAHPSEQFAIADRALQAVGNTPQQAVAHSVARRVVDQFELIEIHEQPGENSPLTGNLPNLANDVVGTGEGRLLPASIWWRIEGEGVEGEGVEGWVGSAFMGRIGATIDFTAQVIELNGNAGMGAETMVDLGNRVADLLKSEEPASRIVVSVAATVGDLGEITLDIVGLGDDALAGYRIHVFGEPAEAGDGFLLDSVEATLLCSRGVSEDGLCV